jgi:hypothetical protein
MILTEQRCPAINPYLSLIGKRVSGLAYFVLINVVYLLVSACSHCNCYQPVPGATGVAQDTNSAINISNIATPHVNHYILSRRPNGLYGFQLFKESADTFLVYITSDRIMNFVGLTDSSRNYSIDVSRYIAGEQYPRFSIVNDSVYFFNPKARTILLTKISGDFALLNEQVFKLQLDREGSGFYFMSNVGYANFYVTFPNVLMPYGFSSKRNFIDSTAYVSYNLLTNQYNKIIKYPKCYEKCSINGYQSMLLVNNEAIYCVFKKHDDIFKFNFKGNLIGSNQIAHNCKLEEFDKAKKQNLAYVRKYQLLGENNCQILMNNKGHLLLIKKLKSGALSDPSSYQGFIFNEKLQQLASVSLQHTVYPFTTFNYGNGFLLFQEKLATALYYDAQNIH